MSIDDKLDILIVKVTDLDKKIDLHCQSDAYELVQIKELDIEQNRLLEIHMRRCAELEIQNKLTKESIDLEIVKLKKPFDLMSYAFKGFFTIGGILTVINLIIEFLNH